MKICCKSSRMEETMEEKLWNVSSSPHVRDHSSTQSIMRDVVIALLPATIIGIYNFRLSAVLVILTCCVSCMLAEYIWQRLMKQKVTTNDFSALLTGLLLALNLPATMGNPKYLWMCILGSVFAIIVVKQLFGGLGQNFMNSDLGARCFLMLAYTAQMTNYVMDGVSSPTPLALLKPGGEAVGDTSLWDMFFGSVNGVIGETSVIFLMAGAVYLLVRREISPRIPFVYVGVFAGMVFLLTPGHNFDFMYMLKEVCGGGLILGAFFMATDYVTSPTTPKGKILFGVALGVITFIFRMFGGSPEGVSYAIIFCNMLVPFIEKVTVPKPFGWEKPKKEAKGHE